jgi:rhomboid family GlyGly-CTERM serine protease
MAPSPVVTEALEYHRGAIADGELWRFVTGQLVHWSAPMLLADVSVILFASCLLARRSPRLLALCIPVSMAAVGAAVHFLAPELIRYRGSSGVASALVIVCALDLAHAPDTRRTGIAVAALMSAKLAFEIATGVSISSGSLPPDVTVAPVAHAAGAASGSIVWSAGFVNRMSGA